KTLASILGSIVSGGKETEKVMKRRPVRLHRSTLTTQRGFTILELVFVCLISIIMAAMAIPLITNVMGNYRLNGAVASVTGTIQSPRYQSIFNGYPFRVTFDATALTYQVQSDVNRTGTFANFCINGATSCPIPMAGSSTPVVINQTTTFAFSP